MCERSQSIFSSHFLLFVGRGSWAIPSSCPFLLQPPPFLPPLLPSRDQLLRLQHRKQPFTHHLHNPAPRKINNHHRRKPDFELYTQKNEQNKVSKIHPSNQKKNKEEKKYYTMERKKKANKETYESLHLHNLQPPRKLGYKVRRSRERNSTSPNESPIKSRVFTNTLAERSSLYPHTHIHKNQTKQTDRHLVS